MVDRKQMPARWQLPETQNSCYIYYYVNNTEVLHFLFQSTAFNILLNQSGPEKYIKFIYCFMYEYIYIYTLLYTWVTFINSYIQTSSIHAVFQIERFIIHYFSLFHIQYKYGYVLVNQICCRSASQCNNYNCKLHYLRSNYFCLISFLMYI